ncbi:nuclear transport factor 2 family protein [Candidatus Palauibacter polyketidifaciens]|uniref:YybH family protein n=1 Tax=Candidatus Palauibacter polyketidifaciens TaxID=3056740 RepID=UPI0023A159B9|nr:nuclear transport factor 2 family protein [Candidatus Palauibacter polyketidifaciens]MDE2720358.1 nuclear transport factor 2 family protein [Candidatus Palauibacter polyketidifaciens]
MTNVTKFCLCLTIGVGLGCGADAAPLPEAHAAAIRDSVAAAMQEFRDLGTAADWEAAGDFYSESPNFRFYENGVLQYRSAADVRAALGAFPPGMRIETEYRDTDVVALAPGLAQVRARFESTITGADGSSFGFDGAVTMIWAHETGGWRILSGHSSAPVPRGG